ncbi:MAG: RNA polymerase sigma factor [Gemmataceae bacterium]
MRDASVTSLSLLGRAQANEPDAWDKLVELYGPLVYHWCLRANLSREDVGDVFQDVFQAVAKHLTKFRKDSPSDTFRGWLRTITRNKINDHFRRNAGNPTALGGSQAQRFLEGVADPFGADESSENDILRGQLCRTLDWIRGEFEERTWRAFWMLQIEGMPSDEVAEELEMTPAAARKAKYRVLQRLREELADLMF